MSLIYQIEIWSKKLLKKGFIETPMGIKKISLKLFWFQKGNFVPNMTKMRFQIKPHRFFLFFGTVFSDTLPVNLRFHDFLGDQKLKLKVLSLKPMVSTENSAKFH